MALSKALFSSATDEWATPQDLFNRLDAELGPFVLDVCATDANAKADHFYDRASNGLLHPWAEDAWAVGGGRGAIWMNPPYGKGIGLWMHKAAAEASKGIRVVCLVPVRTDTTWWHETVMPILRGERPGRVDFLKGRVKFGGAKHGAPFPSAVVVFDGGAK